MNPLRNNDDLDRLRAALQGAMESLELYPWMRARFATFKALLAEARRPHWERIALGLAKLGVTDARGNPPTAGTVRKTWWKVRRDMGALANHCSRAENEARSGIDVAPHRSLAPARSAQAHQAVSPTSAFDPEDVATGDTTGPQFRPARPRNWPRSASKPTPGQPASPKPGGQDYDAVLRQLMDRAKARSLPMPEIPTAEDE